jgi:enterochelin esterase-like enzyme
MTSVPAEPVVSDTAVTGAWVGDETVTFRVADSDRALAGLRLQQDVRIPGDRLDFRRAGDNWELVIERPPVVRMEYLLEFHYPDGRHDAAPDPGNPLRVGGAFGPKSVLEFPGYEPPAWLTAHTQLGRHSAFELAAPSLDATISVSTWSPASAQDNEPLPLLIVNDGPEYDALASLTRYLAAGMAGNWLPRLRAALLGPGQRDRWYSANPRYARALRDCVLPALASRYATTVRIGMGTSLGGLAMLHAYCLYPGIFEAMFLQSGSFFLPRFDNQERWFPHYRRITRFSAAVHAGGLPGMPVRTALTCGAIEENVENNRLMAQTLGAHGYPATLHEVPDVHNYTAWRDAFDPYLTRLLRQAAR